MERLFDYAATLGVSVEYVNLSHLGRSGDYNHSTRTVRLHPGMMLRKERSVFAHELAHATYRDETAFIQLLNEKHEMRADEWAARFLIDPLEYRIAEEKYGANTEWIGQELGVLDRIVKAYERSLSRIGDTVYLHPRLGRADRKFKASAGW